MTVIRPELEKSGPLYSVVRLRLKGASLMDAEPRTEVVLAAEIEISVVHSVAGEKPKTLTASFETPISDDGMLTVIVLLAVASDGSPVV